MRKNISICILRLSSLGDIVLTSVLLRCLRNQFPDANIVMVTGLNYAEAVLYNPHCNTIITVDTKKGIKQLLEKRREIVEHNGGKKYDIVLDLHRNIRTAIIRAGIGKEYGLIDKFRQQKLELVHRKKGIGEPITHIVERYIRTAKQWHIKNDGRGLELWLESEKNSQEYLPDIGTKPQQNIIGIAPGARHYTKRYPQEHFIELIKELRNSFSDASFVLFGGEDEKELCKNIEKKIPFPIINYGGNLSISESVKEIDKCSVMISNDSGLMHIAAARRIPVIAIFGSTVKEFGFAPYGTAHSIIEVNIPCRPCSHIGRDKCPLGHFECMESITPQMIADSVSEVFKKK